MSFQIFLVVISMFILGYLLNLLIEYCQKTLDEIKKQEGGENIKWDHQIY